MNTNTFTFPTADPTDHDTLVCVHSYCHDLAHQGTIVIDLLLDVIDTLSTTEERLAALELAR